MRFLFRTFFTLIICFSVASSLTACKSKNKEDIPSQNSSSDFSSRVESNLEAGVGDSDTSGGIDINDIFGGQESQSSSSKNDSETDSSQTSSEVSSTVSGNIENNSGFGSEIGSGIGSVIGGNNQLPENNTSSEPDSSNEDTDSSSSSSSSTSSFDYNDKNIWTKPV